MIYGFACLFLIGFIWAAFGGAGTALPAFLDRERLTELLIPLFVVFAAWVAQDQLFQIYFDGLREKVNAGLMSEEQMRAQTAWANWYDTDWIAVVVAAGAALVLAVARNRVCFGTSLILHLCAGWWLGFTVLTVGLGLHMTPPRSDNWSGALGMTIGLFMFLYRQREWGIAWSALLTGLFGGLGFSGATLIKLVLRPSGLPGARFRRASHHQLAQRAGSKPSASSRASASRWRMGYLSTRAPRMDESPLVRRWAEPLTILFVVLVISYVNIVKNLESCGSSTARSPASCRGWRRPPGSTWRIWPWLSRSPGRCWPTRVAASWTSCPPRGSARANCCSSSCCGGSCWATWHAPCPLAGSV